MTKLQKDYGSIISQEPEFSSISRLQLLTRKEFDALMLAARGLRNEDIALNLGIGVKAVEARFTRAFKKLGVRSKLEAALLIKEKEASGQLEPNYGHAGPENGRWPASLPEQSNLHGTGSLPNGSISPVRGQPPSGPRFRSEGLGDQTSPRLDHSSVSSNARPKSLGPANRRILLHSLRDLLRLTVAAAEFEPTSSSPPIWHDLMSALIAAAKAASEAVALLDMDVNADGPPVRSQKSPKLAADLVS